MYIHLLRPEGRSFRNAWSREEARAPENVGGLRDLVRPSIRRQTAQEKAGGYSKRLLECGGRTRLMDEEEEEREEKGEKRKEGE